MYSMANDKYTCDYCGFEGDWDIHDDVHGDLWGCEKCGDTFCTKCFTDRYGKDKWMKLMQDNDIIMCPTCYEKVFGGLTCQLLKQKILR